MTYNAEKKLYREKNSNFREVWEKVLPIQTKSVKSPIPHSPTNVQWSCQPFRGWGKKRIWHLSKCHPSTKWLVCVHHVVVFKAKVLHFKFEKTPMKDTDGKRNSMECSVSFLWTDESFSLWNCLSKNSTFFNLISTWRIVPWLVQNKPSASDDFEETWGTFCTLWSRKVRF